MSYRVSYLGCLLLALLVAGCGGSRVLGRTPPPKLAHALGQRWAREASAIAVAAQSGDGCRAQQLAGSLAQQVALKSSSVPARLRTPLLASVTELANRTKCVQIEHPTGPPHKEKPPPPPGKKKKKPGPGDGGRG